MDSLSLVGLGPLLERSAGNPGIGVGIVDGPVLTGHPGLWGARIVGTPGGHEAACVRPGHPACVHGTFVAGILAARRDSGAPAICPECTVYAHAVFTDHSGNERTPAAAPDDLATGILACAAAGARVVNVSPAVHRSRPDHERRLVDALDHAARQGVLIVVAAGDDRAGGSTALTGHPWVVPVAAYDRAGRPMRGPGLGRSIGRRGLGGPGDRVTSLGPDGPPLARSGTSVAAPFVTGTIALLWSLFPTASAEEIRTAVTASGTRTSAVPPLLDATAALQAMTRRRTPA
ncbi:S8 family serine peptidase [Actinomadura chibensis]|uniref:S8 family serine peptidase n=1 Tax=Actinomadura chibensis TaxID=392828 RepID=A0A5D0NPS3_9ACTN|nr:S8 family serine peptidase [Actinomadura chibensis]TYB46255.1 S8 family serine peptidase [Actinomadura chibensis]